MKIANPIYDVVFKYMMNDPRVSRTVLSALLKVDVVSVEVRPHEYSNEQHNALSVFRIDFGATVRESDGTERLILIELQKTWLETETLRFRQYLGVHYSNPKNIMKDGQAIPMVAVYLLGHKVGDIEEPVLYVSHQACDYEGRVVTKGLPNAFVDGLTHDSIIVQIPRVRSGRLNNSLDRVLSVFDQTKCDPDDVHTLNINEEAYGGDAGMHDILYCLTKAAADSTTRMDMNVEDEYYSVIEKRDTEILMRDRQLAEQKVQISEQKVQISEQKAQLTEQKAQLAEKNEQLAEKNEQLAEQERLLRSTVRLLLDAGMTPDEIASRLGVSSETVERMT